MGIFVFYASHLMKGWQVRETCRLFREQEAKRQQSTLKLVNGTLYKVREA